jgi:hypothetical protein
MQNSSVLRRKQLRIADEECPCRQLASKETKGAIS